MCVLDDLLKLWCLYKEESIGKFPIDYDFTFPDLVTVAYLNIDFRELDPKHVAGLIYSKNMNLFLKISLPRWGRYLIGRNISIDETELFKFVKHFEELKNWTRSIIVNANGEQKPETLLYLCQIVHILINDHRDYNGGMAIYAGIKGALDKKNIPKKIKRIFKKIEKLLCDDVREKYQLKNDCIPFIKISCFDLWRMEYLYNTENDMEEPLEKCITKNLLYYKKLC